MQTFKEWILRVFISSPGTVQLKDKAGKISKNGDQNLFRSTEQVNIMGNKFQHTQASQLRPSVAIKDTNEEIKYFNEKYN